MSSRAAVRAVMAIALGAALGAGVVVGTSSGPTVSPCGAGTSGNTPLGAPPFAMSTPAETTMGADHWYNFSVVSSSGGLTLRDLTFEVLTTAGAIVAPGSGWSLTVLNGSGGTVAAYGLSGGTAGTWTVGGSLAVWNTMVVSLRTSPDGVSGDQWVVLLAGTGDCGLNDGSLSEGIP